MTTLLTGLRLTDFRGYAALDLPLSDLERAAAAARRRRRGDTPAARWFELAAGVYQRRAS